MHFLYVHTLRQIWCKWDSSCSGTSTHQKVFQISEVSRTFLQRKESHTFERIKTSSDWFMLVVVCKLLGRLCCCALHKNHIICRYLEHFLLWNPRNIPQALYNLNSQLSTGGSLLGKKKKKNLLITWQPTERIGTGFLHQRPWTQTVLKDPYRALCDSLGDQITGREKCCQ